MIQRAKSDTEMGFTLYVTLIAIQCVQKEVMKQ